MLLQKPRPGVSSARVGKTGSHLKAAVTRTEVGRVGDLCRSPGTTKIRGKSSLIQDISHGVN